MKKIPIFTLVIIAFFSCTNEDSVNTNTNQLNTYEIKKIIGNKQIVGADAGTNSLFFMKEFSFCIDTLEIDLNTPYANSFSLRIETSTFNSITSTATGVAPHVNYIKFINLASNWISNKTKKIYLKDKSNVPPIFITYSECNINLSNYPTLFVDNPNYPTYTLLDVKPKISTDIETITSSTEYNVGDIFYYNGLKYIIISKN
jgi:hypothetical protein